MSNFTNVAENLIADWMRGQGLGSLPGSFYVGLASAASDGSITELSGTGYARVPIVRSLANFAGTQGSGTTLASNGTSHQTSNNNSISFGTSGSAWGTANFAVLFSASTSGNPLTIHPLAVPISIGSGVPVALAPGDLTCTVGLANGTSDYLANAFIDLWFRAQAFTFPTTGFFALFTTAPTSAGGGVECNGLGYSRASIPFSLAGFCGTGSPGSTSASSGTDGVISNNLAIAFPSPGGVWGTIGDEGVYDALSGGNLLFFNAITSRTILAGSSPQTHAPASWSITVA